jgi:Fe2+ or Zn2+ uptake regulation protein
MPTTSSTRWNACRERGLRLTPIRALVVRLIAQAGRPVKAYDLLEMVRNADTVGAMRRRRYTGRWIS